jgi:nitroimidazol reductase NimA-like FMN-containing flavoprotein (pyridoxamine 5'-phosphate oxidase superfamily)
MSIAMSRDERETFLAGLHIGLLTVPDGNGPLTCPVWYAYEPGGEIWLVTPAEARKLRNVAVGTRVGFCAQDEELPPKYVTVQGEVTAIDPATAEKEVTEMAVRYLGEEIGAAYVKGTREADPKEEVVVRIRPVHWFSADFAKRFEQA